MENAFFPVGYCSLVPNAVLFRPAYAFVLFPGPTSITSWQKRRIPITQIIDDLLKRGLITDTAHRHLLSRRTSLQTPSEHFPPGLNPTMRARYLRPMAPCPVSKSPPAPPPDAHPPEMHCRPEASQRAILDDDEAATGLVERSVATAKTADCPYILQVLVGEPLVYAATLRPHLCWKRDVLLPGKGDRNEIIQSSELSPGTAPRQDVPWSPPRARTGVPNPNPTSTPTRQYGVGSPQPKLHSPRLLTHASTGAVPSLPPPATTTATLTPATSAPSSVVSASSAPAVTQPVHTAANPWAKPTSPIRASPFSPRSTNPPPPASIQAAISLLKSPPRAAIKPTSPLLTHQGPVLPRSRPRPMSPSGGSGVGPILPPRIENDQHRDKQARPSAPDTAEAPVWIPDCVGDVAPPGVIIATQQQPEVPTLVRLPLPLPPPMLVVRPAAPRPKKQETDDLFPEEDPACTEWEIDEKRLKQRQKQVNYGKNTLGYQRYLAQIKAWRRYLHNYDDKPSGLPEEAPSEHSADDVMGDKPPEWLPPLDDAGSPPPPPPPLPEDACVCHPYTASQQYPCLRRLASRPG
ncbi:hypothetical protein PAPYR_4743 [Paratrimastix pyriformis]|uniref:Histone RNA hairpin-binding protein RNA-binding domain-containing protein n=1 Tax=Paratrimastix pyriformis TaxID=342808 RepID=A0ABQ8UJ17_9EUKA|nr:hypothetical protein PAPYR_4743 [Paratrimastix pyriformis]